MRRGDFTTREIAGLLKGMRDVKCRSSYEQGCRCPVHSDGSNAPRERRGRLVAVADETGVTFAQCNGSMTCTCQRCCEQRAVLVSHPKHTPRQPWQPLPAARAA